MVETKTIKEVLEELGYKPQLLNHEFRMPAAFRQGDHPQAISINSTTGQWYDHVELRGGSFASFLRLHNRNADDVQIAAAAKKIERPTIFKQSSLDLLFPQDRFYNERGISSETLRLFKGGVCHSGKLYNRYTLPIINPDGRIHGFSGRHLKWEQLTEEQRRKTPKWKHLGNKSFWVYPAFLTEPYIRAENEIVLLESPGDCLALWEAGVRHTLICFGLKLHPKLLSYIVSLNPRRIRVSTNNDVPDERCPEGRGQRAAKKIVAQLGKFFAPAKIDIVLSPAKDWGETPRHEISQFWS